MADIAVSVLCPVYNHAKYLRKCLDGFVLQKTNFPFEVIVHDDASTDGSAEIIREYEQNYPDLIRPIYQSQNQRSQNISYFRTFLYPAVRGKYFAICEGDDYWSDYEKLQRQFDALESHPECSFSTHIVRTIAEDGQVLSSTIPNVLRFQEGVLKSDDLRTRMFSEEFYPFQTTSYFFRSDLLQYISSGASEFLLQCPALDYGWILSSLVLGDCYFVNREMSCYRRNSTGSWSNRQKKKKNHSIFQQRVANSLHCYDKLTDGHFHDLIEKMIARNEYSSLSYGQQFAKRKAPQFAEIYNHYSSRQKFLLGVCRYFPPFSPIYQSMKNARSKQITLR